MSIEDEINRKTERIRNELHSTMMLDRDYKQLKQQYDRQNISMSGYVIVNLPDEYRRVINEALPGIRFRHKVRVINMPDVVRVIIGNILVKSINLNNGNGSTSICTIYENKLEGGWPNGYAFIVPTVSNPTKENPQVYLLILSDGKVAMESSFNADISRSSYQRITKKLMISPADLRDEIIKAEADARSINRGTIENKNGLYNTGSGNKSGPCYIATCVYGSYDCPEVWTLRRFRDSVLLTNAAGRMFVKVYYALSPAIVRKFGGTRLFVRTLKAVLDRFVKNLNNRGISGEKYSGN